MFYGCALHDRERPREEKNKRGTDGRKEGR